MSKISIQDMELYYGDFQATSSTDGVSEATMTAAPQ